MDKACKFCEMKIPEVAAVCPHCCIVQDRKMNHGIKLAIVAFIVSAVLIVGIALFPK
jgi:hypothetical protein